MSYVITGKRKMKPCPFCGAKAQAVVGYDDESPNWWKNNLWHFQCDHDAECILYSNELFGFNNFGESENGKPTEEVREYVAKWNKRAEVVKHANDR